MRRIILDREGTARVRDGFTLITSEVDFLKEATNEECLHIRGERLCAWASAFYNGREIECEEAHSYSREIKQLLPGVSDQQVEKLLTLLRSALENMTQPLSLESIVYAVDPDAHSVWHDAPSIDHLAAWFLWLENYPDVQVVEPVLDAYLAKWRSEQVTFPHSLYAIRSNNGAKEALRNWLGIGDRSSFPVREVFPAIVPQTWVDEARETWLREIITTGGAKFVELATLAIPETLIHIAAQVAFKYFSKHPEEITGRVMELLTPRLKGQQIAELRKVLPPDPPGPLPENSAEIVEWYLKQYLPYRQWSLENGSEDSRQVILKSAQDFSNWYLDAYKRALSTGRNKEWLSFNAVNTLSPGVDDIVLVVILDGLNVTDAQTLIKLLYKETQRVKVMERYVFAPLPTITQFAKDALLKGVPPRFIVEQEPLGSIIPDRQAAAQRLQNADGGQVYFWRVEEPDKTYHAKNGSENLLSEIDGRLAAEASKIVQVIDQVSQEKKLIIIITTDHGRLLAKSSKIIPVPPGMESEGRAAWGRSPMDLANESMVIQDGVAYLSGDLYGMSSDFAISLTEDSFMNNAGVKGSENYPHGGAFPEEVIIPWYTLVRDYQQPNISTEVTGNGKARRDGSFVLTVLNQSEEDVTLISCELILKNGSTISLHPSCLIRALSSEVLKFPHDSWPSAVDVQEMRARVCYRTMTGIDFEQECSARIESQDLYYRSHENILEDLD